MDMIFDIAGQACVADRVQMRGNTIMAEFSSEAAGPLATAYDESASVVLMGMPRLDVTYSVQTYRADGVGGCSAVFSVNSSAGRVLH
ncbi:hypothetical protein [Celeribacter sp.]|uniref:hypothetical protein n=1 Tax=Celeribacter sp. TaxID=1890673 RepID=UPI003A945D6E